mmetsp:Transcript_14264/g.35410  ORF Transcript_14264/g.35410 Transcript_14264/m.35410 type:complete len:535 (+) Transcript_14264:182-1786(+)|eukprot:CAMPEP_0178991836 /NCGR_PEP_ID=MMETSP0795-20121207/5764_1 /TAXON_ID=88552 /ORGANISM="Amoebophrya sp., Strain Ameob2" /LENGTH=534 /DNA_ID=CAMNT_0020683619 /DNA_START=171 /DNA_END=1775 /DNA_ORIENTATION=+
MKLLRRNIDPATQSGSVVLIPEESEDLWHVYNLAAIGDKITAQTWRKVEKQQLSGTTQKERRRVRLTLDITKPVDYDAAGDELRFSGTNATANEYVALGANHTISLELNEKLELWKDRWDSVFLDIVKDACDIRTSADTCVLLLDQAQGLAQFFLLTNVLAKVVFKVQTFLPKNRRFEKGNYDKALKKFYEKIVEGIKLHVNFAVVKCVVVAGPGFLKTEFLKWLKEDNGKNVGGIDFNGWGNVAGSGGGNSGPHSKPNNGGGKKNKGGASNNSNSAPAGGAGASSSSSSGGSLRKVSEIFFEGSCSTANKQGLQELLDDPQVQKRIATTKASENVKTLDELYRRLQQDPERACYGFPQVRFALENAAVDKLLVTDSLFRQKNDLTERRKYVDMVDECRQMTGKRDSVVVFSSQHVSGEKLAAVGGVAALLRYPVEHLMDYGSSDEEDEEDVGWGNEEEDAFGGTDLMGLGGGRNREAAAVEENLRAAGADVENGGGENEEGLTFDEVMFGGLYGALDPVKAEERIAKALTALF